MELRSGRNTADNSHNGGLASEAVTNENEDRRGGGPRRGDLQWVVPFEKRANFRIWLFQFTSAAQFWLSKEVYPNEEDRAVVYLNALTRAATLGKNEELLVELELLHSDGLTCEALLAKIKEIYQPQDELLKQKAGQDFLHFRREGRLCDSLRKLNSLVLECKKADYRPDVATMCVKYKSLLRKDEAREFATYFAAKKFQFASTTQTEDQRLRRIMEAFACDGEGLSKEQEQSGFCGAAIGNRGGRGQAAENRNSGGRGGRQRGQRRHGFRGGRNDELSC